jgi:hypothetical protein
METTDTVRRTVQTIADSKLTRASSKLRDAIKLMDEVAELVQLNMSPYDMTAVNYRQMLAKAAGVTEGARDILQDLTH